MSATEPTARARLIEALRVLHDLEAIEVTVVFDSRGRPSVADPPEAPEGVVVKFAAAGLTADGEIERLVATEPVPGRCVVATADATIRGNVMAAGGDCLSPDDLRAWIGRCRARLYRKLRVRGAAGPDSWGNKLPL